MRLSNLTRQALSLDDALAAEAKVSPTPCAVLRVRVERSNNWLDAFTALLWLVAFAAAGMLGLAIFLAADKQVPATIASVVSTVLASGGFKVLLTLRSAQEREFDHYVGLAKAQNCPE
jgi:VIT1/CCC1 family predicted Fe2+/Mn2+ transporter